MQAHRLQLLAVAILALSAVAAIPPAAATPTFLSGVSKFNTNQDNNYDAYTDGTSLVVIAHTVDTSNTIVIEVSTDGGSTYTTLPTGRTSTSIRVAAASSSNIVVADCTTRTAIYTTNGGATNPWPVSAGWGVTSNGAANSPAPGCDIDYSGSSYVVGYLNCYFASCGSGSIGSPAPLIAYYSASSTTGATWGSVVNYETSTVGGTSFGAFAGDFGISATGTNVQVFYKYLTGLSGSTGAANPSKVHRAASTNSGASYTVTEVNDAFSPLAANAGFGENLHASKDGNALIFEYGGAEYSALLQSGFWYLTTLRAGTVLQGSAGSGAAFTCANGGYVGVFQGISGDDRISYANVPTPGSATLTAVTGDTSVVGLPFAAYQIGAAITIIYGDLGNGKTLLKTTTGNDCAAPGTASAPNTFCADPEETDYGYTYREGVQFDNDGVSGINLADSFVFTGDTGNFDYLAKSYDSGTQSFKAIVRIEASNDDATSSVFRVNFAKTDGSLASATTKGDGLKTGHFSNHVEAEFQESGNDWRISVYYVIDGASGGARTKLGSSTLYGSPNTPTTFNVTVDSREGDLFLAVRDSSGSDIISRGLPFIFQDAVWQSVWYVGYGANSILDSTTALDDNQDAGDDDDSTCIFDLLGSALVNGPSGTTPASLVPSFTGSVTSTSTVGSIFHEDGGVLPPGFTDTTYDFFLGLLFMIMLAVGCFFAFGKSPIGAGIGGGMGFLGAFAFGLFPTWMLAVTVVIVVAIVFLGIRSKAAGN